MKLGVFAVLLGNKPLEEALQYFKKAGIQAVEIGCGGYPGKAHCDPAVLLNDDRALADFKALFPKYGMELCCLSVHGNPVHPDKEIAAGYHADFEQAVLLAEKLGINRIVTFSGCPGGSPKDKTPNWITCPWPEDFSKALDYQWNKVLSPYWKKAAAFAKSHGVTRIALEMHPGFCVYNPETLMKLRKAVGPVIGANFDPSHLFWQGIDPVAAIRYLGDAIYYFHAKDTKVDAINTARIGVLDTKHYGDEINRAWVFRSVGYGHGAETWKEIVSNLRMVGYDDVLSIEHEDSLMSQNEGLMKAVALLKDVITFESTGAIWWA
jgi:sugar phosphate isomerase/epimerase